MMLASVDCIKKQDTDIENLTHDLPRTYAFQITIMQCNIYFNNAPFLRQLTITKAAA